MRTKKERKLPKKKEIDRKKLLQQLEGIHTSLLYSFGSCKETTQNVADRIEKIILELQ